MKRRTVTRALALIVGAAVPSSASGQAGDAHRLPADMPVQAERAWVWLASVVPSTPEAVVAHQRNRMRVAHALAAIDGGWMDSATAQLGTLRAFVPSSHVDAWSGALEMLRAKYALWPPHKLDHVRAGRRLLDRAVTRAPDDAEVRYLRLVSGHYLPFFLRDGAQVDADARAVATLLPGQARRFPDAWAANLATFLLDEFDLPPDLVRPLRPIAARGGGGGGGS